MKAFKLIGVILLAMVLCTSCDLIAKKLGYKPITEETKSTAIEENHTNEYSTSTSTVVKTFYVKAQIYHFIENAGGCGGHEKATNNYSDIKISVYSDGDVYCTSITHLGFPLPVRYSNTDGFDYECNSGNTIYKFNTSELN